MIRGQRSMDNSRKNDSIATKTHRSEQEEEQQYPNNGQDPKNPTEAAMPMAISAAAQASSNKTVLRPAVFDKVNLDSLINVQWGLFCFPSVARVVKKSTWQKLAKYSSFCNLTRLLWPLRLLGTLEYSIRSINFSSKP